MKNAPQALINLFASDQAFEQFDLYTFTLSTGLVLRYANTLFDVTYLGNTWLCGRSGGVIIDEDGSTPTAHWTTGLDVGTWQVNILPRDTDTIGSLPFGAAVRAGLLDEATMQVDRAYVTAWPAVPSLAITPVGTVNVFFGRIAEIDFGRSAIIINANDPRELLAIQIPRNLYSAQCRYSLFDTGCTLTKASFAVAATATGATNNLVNTSDTSKADGYYALGEIAFNSGQNAGLRQMIRNSAQAAGLLTLLTPMPFPIANGDSVTLYPGCDKTLATCGGKFANTVNFGGEPFIPAAETAV